MAVFGLGLDSVPAWKGIPRYSETPLGLVARKVIMTLFDRGRISHHLFLSITCLSITSHCLFFFGVLEFFL